jgi:prolipoprotein diacylglyceryltransferase
MEFTLLFAAFFGVLGYWLMLRWEGPRGNAAGCAANLWDVGLGAAAVGLIVGRIAAMVGDGVNPITNPGDLLIVRAGVATGWASLGAVATIGWVARHELWTVLDAIAPAALAGLSGWHLGCLARDACLGTTTDLPWAVSQSGGGIGRHPVEIYAALLFAVAALALARWKARGRPPLGVPAGIALAVAGAVRLATEPMRPTLGTGPVWWYAAAVLVGSGVVVWRWQRRRRPIPELA